jgi:hypothetical protein
MLPRRGHRASSWRRYREGNVRSVASPGSVSLVIVGSKDRRVARRGRNYRLSRCDAGHTLTCLAYCRTVPIDQGATCDRDRQAGERRRTKTLLPDLGTVPLNQSERTYFLCSAMLLRSVAGAALFQTELRDWASNDRAARTTYGSGPNSPFLGGCRGDGPCTIAPIATKRIGVIRAIINRILYVIGPPKGLRHRRRKSCLYLSKLGHWLV